MSSTILIQSTQGFADKIGDPVRADGWYGYPDSLYTVAISTTNFLGNIYVEASLALVPGDNDWFPIELQPFSPYLSYPNVSQAPTGLNGGDTGTSGFTFRGNYLYLRARIIRSTIFGTGLTGDQISLLGDARIVLSQSQTTYSSSTTLPPIIGFTQIMNIGSGYQTYAGINELGIPQFRAIAAGAGVAIVQSNDTLTINALTSDGGQIISENGSFIDLTDTPSSYAYNANSFLVVNPAENAIAFRQLPPIALSGLLSDAVGILPVVQGGSGQSSFSSNSILIGNGVAGLNKIAAPTNADTILTWTGSAFAWTPLAGSSGSSSLIVQQNGANPFVAEMINFTGSGVSVYNDSSTAVVNISSGTSLPTNAGSIARYTIKVAYSASTDPTSVMSAPSGWTVSVNNSSSTINITHNLNLRLSYFMITGFDGTNYSTTSEGSIYTQPRAMYQNNLSLQLMNMTSVAFQIGNSNPNAFIYIDLFFIV